MDYKEINKKQWNARTDVHFTSQFYDNPSFIAGRNSLNDIELALLGDVRGKKILHLQCHFGQDTLSLARMGAIVTGMDLSDVAIEKARELAAATKLNARFVCSDVYDLPEVLKDDFDMVFTSYGAIGWLPNLPKWGNTIAHFLKPGGTFILVEFHPVVWMFDDIFKDIAFGYFNSGPIIETHEGTYTDSDKKIVTQSVSWNHTLSDVFNALKANRLSTDEFYEYDYSPYNCFKNMLEVQKGRFMIKGLEKKLPLVYAVKGRKGVVK